MLVHPDIAALRSDRAPQRHAQGAMQAAREAWRAEPGADAMIAELAAFGDGAPLEDCPKLEEIFTGQHEAERLTGLMSHHFCAALAANPFGHPPFRNGFASNAASLLLARSGRAQLMVQAREPESFEAGNCIFTDALRYDAVIGGRATARIVRITRHEDTNARFANETIVLEPGCRLAFDLATEALQVERVERRLVVLRLVRMRDNPLPAREYIPETGALRHQCAATLATSRQEALIALLGRMERADAAPVFAEVALRDGDDSLRWQAVRECLALDSGAGFAALGDIARREDDPLADIAGALRAQLIETYPQLLEVEPA